MGGHQPEDEGHEESVFETYNAVVEALRTKNGGSAKQDGPFSAVAFQIYNTLCDLLQREYDSFNRALQADVLQADVQFLDEKPGVVPCLVPGIQGGKSPGSLGQTWDQAKSLKFILIDSNFLLSPCPDSLRHARCFPGLFEIFS